MENKSVNVVKTISVVGLGYVGLPTSVAFHDAGYRVFGIDKNQEILDSWLGYRFETHKVDSGCQIEVIPDPPQHRRHFEGFVYRDGRISHKKNNP